jgi:histone H3/H4
VEITIMELTLQPIRRLFKTSGAKRVSNKAAAELAKILEERAKLIATEAKKISEHSGRRTVLRRDIKMARKTFEK